VGAGIIFGDPLLVDPAIRDARLSNGSPCIDAGDPAAAPATDYFGTDTSARRRPRRRREARHGLSRVRPRTIAVQHDAAGVVFDRWVTGYSGAYSGGGYVYGRWTGTELTASFTGARVRWIGPKQPSYGMADVYIDGRKVATWTATRLRPRRLAFAGDLGVGNSDRRSEHTLSIRLTGEERRLDG
jgi:hypothetical protein